MKIYTNIFTANTKDQFDPRDIRQRWAYFDDGFEFRVLEYADFDTHDDILSVFREK